MSAEELPVPRLRARYVKREEPDRGRVVTVTRVWEAEDGHTGVAYEWRDDKPGQCGSACPLDVFHRTYRAEGTPESARDDLIWRCMQAGLSEAWATRQVDAYAHELAEKVMALLSTVPDLKARQLFRDGYAAALMVAALTIDPEVPDGG